MSSQKNCVGCASQSKKQIEHITSIIRLNNLHHTVVCTGKTSAEMCKHFEKIVETSTSNAFHANGKYNDTRPIMRHSRDLHMKHGLYHCHSDIPWHRVSHFTTATNVAQVCSSTSKRTKAASFAGMTMTVAKNQYFHTHCPGAIQCGTKFLHRVATLSIWNALEMVRYLWFIINYEIKINDSSSTWLYISNITLHKWTSLCGRHMLNSMHSKTCTEIHIIKTMKWLHLLVNGVRRLFSSEPVARLVIAMCSVQCLCIALDWIWVRVFPCSFDVDIITSISLSYRSY